MSAVVDFRHCEDGIARRSNLRLNGLGISIDFLIKWEIASPLRGSQ